MSIRRRKAQQVQPEIWVGLDLAKKTFEAAIALDIDVHSMAGCGFATTPKGIELLLAWCDEMIRTKCPGARLRFVMEATGTISVTVFSWLLKKRPETAPAIINPHYIKAFGDSLGIRNKTDKTDARIIARYGHDRSPAGEILKSPEQERLLALTRERRSFVEQCTAEKNRLSEPCVDLHIVKMRKQHIEFLKKRVKELDQLILELVEKTPDLNRDYKLLVSIPGIGRIVAVTILAELGDLRRFENPRKLAAFCGVSPREFASGTSVKRPTRMCRKGNKHVRPMLNLAARSLISRRRYAMGRLFDDLLARGKSKCSAIGILARKLLVLMRAILISGKPYVEHMATCGQVVQKAVENTVENLGQKVKAA